MPPIARLVPLCGAIFLLIVVFITTKFQDTSLESSNTIAHASNTNTDRRDGASLPVLKEISLEKIANRKELKLTTVSSGFEGRPDLRNADPHQVGSTGLDHVRNDPSSIINRGLAESRAPQLNPQISEMKETPNPVPWICFASETAPELMAEINANTRRHLADSSVGAGAFRESAFQFFPTARWNRTAITQAPFNGPNRLRQGDPVTITWSIIPDGTPIAANGSIPAESSDPSNLIATLNGIYGDQATWLALMQQVFDRWEELTGNRYVYEPSDDGASFPGSAGSVGNRGDVRIGGHSIDGNFNTLAYNYGPTTGDMVIDTADGYYNSTTSNSLRFRNVFAHEHGHGLGLAHVCPQNSTKLMEPSATSVFDGPQHDDIFSAQRQYGDRYEDTNTDGNSDDNDAFSTRADLGSLPFATTTLTPLSIDDNSDQDFFGFGTGSDALISVTLTPLGLTYLEGGQNSDGTCSAGTPFNSLAVHNLGFSVLDSGGNVLLTRDANAAGVNESTTDFALPAGTQFGIRVFGDSTDNAQLYELAIELTDPNAPADVSITGSSAIESTGAVAFNVQIAAPSLSDVTVDYLVEALTATAGDDFIAASGSTTIPAGDLSETINVLIVDDALDEDNETMRVTLSNPVNGVLLVSQADGRILDDDAPPSVSTSDVEASETASSVSVPVTLDAASGRVISIVIGTSSGTATAGADFTAANTSVSFAPGEISKTFDVALLDDAAAEDDEMFSVLLSSPTNVSIGTGTATGTILDDDALIQLAGTGELSSNPAGGVAIGWNAVIGREYTILFSIDLINWSPLPGAELITADEVDESVVHDPLPGIRGFYRVVEGYVPEG